MKIEMMEITSQRELAPKIYEMTLKGQLVKKMQTPGQFLHIRVPRADLLLRRPISLNEINQEAGTCRIIYRVEGDGTLAFSKMQAGDVLDVMGPLGNGFSLSGLQEGDEAYLVGGGIGIPPLYELSRQLVAIGVKPIHFLGYASNEVKYYEDEFKALGETHIATDDGSYGVHGHVGHLLDAMTSPLPAAVFSCGSKGLMQAVEDRFVDTVANVQLSLESRMACGMGACYACVCKVKDDPTGLKSLKVCDEGPVFPAGKVVL
ncbi:dihydroorotate dehydrogenase electron transfer subunit [Enterococcus lemanii]|nr:dihydroorotate dehydrogenase electron transfer subunit [Enterococcus lemanii]